MTQAAVNLPAVIDAPLGKGHVVLFAINPMWRQETQGSFSLVFNAMLHFDHLSPPSPRASKASDSSKSAVSENGKR